MIKESNPTGILPKKGIGDAEKLHFSSGIQLITEKELSQITRRSLSSIRKDRMRGSGVPYVKYPGGSVRYEMRDITEFIEKNKRSFTSEVSLIPDYSSN